MLLVDTFPSKPSIGNAVGNVPLYLVCCCGTANHRDGIWMSYHHARTRGGRHEHHSGVGDKAEVMRAEEKKEEDRK